MRRFPAQMPIPVRSHDSNRAHIATCSLCGCLSSLRWPGWAALPADAPDGHPAPAFLCPPCAARELYDRMD
jgi:hypothetical protein